MEVAIKMVSATLFPVVITVILTLLEQKTKYGKINFWIKQIIVGLLFGGFAILSTAYGVPLSDEAIMNVRDAAPMCAALIFGAPAGVIAGVIGGVYRYFCVYWGGVWYTRVGCSLATVLAGVCGGMMHIQVFEKKRTSPIVAFGLGTTMEVLHMLLILITNINDVTHAFSYVQTCTLPMILCNGISLSLAVAAGNIFAPKQKIDIKEKKLSNDFAFKLLVCVFIAFILSSAFVKQIINRITFENAELYRSVTIYLTEFVQVLIYTALFILIYEMLKKKIIRNIDTINTGLRAITNGELDTVINVNSHKEFVELSQHINKTVSVLKNYITEAEQRIDSELEFARQIQYSALPTVFPAYPNRLDFDLFASMNAAKEVGGDFYDFYVLDRFTLVFMVADVSGKGIPAAMFMMTAKTMIKGLVEGGKDIDVAFNEANESLCEHNDMGMFVTAWIGKMDFRTGTLSYVNAGHNPPLICRRGAEFEYLKVRPNFVLAGMDGTVYRKHEIKLNPGDKIFLYTDGVTEAADKEEKLYGERRLVEFLNKHSTDKVQDICTSLKADVAEFSADVPQSDDITMLCVEVNELYSKDRIEVYPNFDSINLVADFITNRMQRSEYPRELINNVLIVVDEIYSNIVRYSKASFAELTVVEEPKKYLLLFRDNGAKFDPTGTEEPDITLSAESREIGGLGIFMVKKLTSGMKYTYEDGENRLCLEFDT